MIDWLLRAAFQVSLVVVGIVAFWRLRRWSKSSQTKWRRRFGLLFFLAPVFAWTLLLFGLEESARPFEAIVRFQTEIDEGITRTIDAADEQLPGLWHWVVRQAVTALVYAGLGIIVGWPFDRMSPKPEEPDAGKPKRR